MKKRGVIILCLLLAAGGAGGWYYYKNIYQKADAVAQSADTVYMEAVKNICDQGAIGFTESYTGMVDTQETKNVQLDSGKTLKEVFVSVGDEVKKGDPLFSYDTEDMVRKVKEADLELEELRYGLENLNKQLAGLQAQAAKAKPDELPAIQLEILGMENQIRRQEYNISLKELERGRMEDDQENAVVFAEMDGLIQAVNRDDTGLGSGGSAFITILATGDYRIKGNCNEMNIRALSVGDPMLIRPRANEELVYTGVISKIDTEPAKQEGEGSSGDNSASKYTFYVKLNEKMDMMLGQHVIMEQDFGQEKAKEGLWIPEYYLMEEDGEYYVWTCSEKKKCVKKKVETGERDEELMEVEIVSGLTMRDYIAYPEDYVAEGNPVLLPDEM